MKRSKAPVFLDQCEGNGPEAQRGNRGLYNRRMWLHRGDAVPAHMLRVEGGVTLVDYQVELGRRQVIPGIEQALLGMRVGATAKFVLVRSWLTETRVCQVLFRRAPS